MQTRSILRAVLLTVCVPLIPLVATHSSEEWNWDPLDFAVMGTLIFGTGLAYELVTSKVGTAEHRAAVGVALAATLLLLWVTGAVGIIGDGPVNLLYFGVPAVLVIGTVVARLDPRGMARALFATALAQAVVPLIALASGEHDFAPGVLHVFGLNAVFVALYVGSALLFRRASVSSPPQR